MSSAQVAWQRANTKQVGLRLNRNQDGDIIDYLEATGTPSQTIRRLIREEIARTGWVAPSAAPHPASMSLNGGESWILPEELEDEEGAIASRWDDITAAMEPQLYEDTDANYSPCSLPEFIRHYLEQSGQDLVVAK